MNPKHHILIRGCWAGRSSMALTHAFARSIRALGTNFAAAVRLDRMPVF